MGKVDREGKKDVGRIRRGEEGIVVMVESQGMGSHRS